MNHVVKLFSKTRKESVLLSAIEGLSLALFKTSTPFIATFVTGAGTHSRIPPLSWFTKSSFFFSKQLLISAHL